MDWLTSEGIIRRCKSPWGLKKSMEAVAIGVVLVAVFSIFVALGQQRKYGCHFPAIFNFGDSNSDTGGRSAAFYRVPSPYGNAFGKPSGRYSDGHVIIDVMAEKLGLPYLSAYLDSIGANFRHGANFATAGSTIQPVDGRMFDARFSPISLNVQLLQFEQFKARTIELYNQAKSSYNKISLPRPEDFSKALYMLDIGQNDLHAGFRSMTEEQVQASIPNITNPFALAVEKLYHQGARAFWIHNTGPIGCLPFIVKYSPPRPDNVDPIGCVKSQNEVAQEFNRQLKEMVYTLRAKFPEAMLTYVDIYSAKYALISEAEKHGFANPLGYCCGGENHVQCGTKAIVNENEVYGASCSNPSTYINWDGIHYSHAANRWIANQILDGSLSDPPIPITEACHKPVNLRS
ncbi:hypothetical protein L1049_007064 [Liquidambar formosana]|uniref:GDSL esterase/lipase At5g14450-like n=1 Tax=Liquidambar formosana TaxID=63359 RepID=A0AAP0RI89_LIQFO